MFHHVMRTASIVGAVIIALTIVAGMYLLLTERNWFVLAMGVWAALSARVIIRDHQRIPDDDLDDDPEDED